MKNKTVLYTLGACLVFGLLGLIINASENLHRKLFVQTRNCECIIITPQYPTQATQGKAGLPGNQERHYLRSVQDNFMTLGGGVVYHADTEKFWILTSGHFNTNDLWVQFTFTGLRSNPIRAKIHKKVFRKDGDFAILSINKHELKDYEWPVPAKVSNTVVFGEEIYCNKFGSRCNGIVAKIEPHGFMTNMRFYPGNSGSGVFNKKDELIGLVWMQNGFCVSCIRIWEIMNESKN